MHSGYGARLTNPKQIPSANSAQGTVIPNFWLFALKNHSQLREIVEAVDPSPATHAIFCCN